MREDGKLSAKKRDGAVDDMIGLVGAVGGILQMQAKSDAERIQKILGGMVNKSQMQRIGEALAPIVGKEVVLRGRPVGRPRPASTGRLARRIRDDPAMPFVRARECHLER